MRILTLLSYPQSGVKALHIVIALKIVTLVSNKKSILVEMFDFAVTQIDNFCKDELITVLFILFDGKDTSLVFFRTEMITEFVCSNAQLYLCNNDRTVRLFLL